MNKIAAEIIAGLIPHKMTRNRWRGILRYGLINAFMLKRKLKRDNTQPSRYLTVCAIAKNEGPYFKEWLDWHIGQGVEKFYIYDNESADNTREVLQPYIASGIVEYKFWPGKRMQLPAYDDCFEAHRYDSRWIAVIDLDEFLVPVKDASVVDFLHRFESFPCVEINWLCYGSSGAEKQEPGGVMQRFKRHSFPGYVLNRHVKSIVDPRSVFNMIGCHEAARISGHAADSHGDRIRANFRDREPQQDVIKINHYAIKSREEFIAKKSRGRARTTKNLRTWDYFEKYDHNEIDETLPAAPRLVVSMTSFPAAIEYAVKALKSILAGSMLPDRLVLYLTFSQFGHDGLPENLLQLERENPIFEIHDYTDDIQSYRKIVPALRDFPNSTIVTVDDDVAYHRNMLRDLLVWHNRLPNAVIAHHAKRIMAGAPYRKWPKYRWYHFLKNRVKVSFDTIQTGVGGVLYPPHALNPQMMSVELFSKMAPTTDDIWLWAAAAANGYPVVPVAFGHNKPKGLGKPKSLSLKTSNFKAGIDRNAATLDAILQRWPEIQQRLKGR